MLLANAQVKSQMSSDSSLGRASESTVKMSQTVNLAGNLAASKLAANDR